MNCIDLLGPSKPVAQCNDPGSSAVAESGVRASGDRGNRAGKEPPPGFLEALWLPGHMGRRGPDERPAISLPWKSAGQVCPVPANNNNSGLLNQAVERTELVNAWSDIAAARLAKEQALQERNEAQSDIAEAELLRRQAREQLRHASAEKAYADHARELAKRQIELAEADFASAKRIQEQAQSQLAKARLFKEQATRRIDATRLEITCQACLQQFQCQIPSSPTTTSWPDQCDTSNSNSSPNILTMPSNFQRRIAAADETDILKKEM